VSLLKRGEGEGTYRHSVVKAAVQRRTKEEEEEEVEAATQRVAI
jgi:hypothetical protein